MEKQWEFRDNFMQLITFAILELYMYLVALLIGEELVPLAKKIVMVVFLAVPLIAFVFSVRVTLFTEKEFAVYSVLGKRFSCTWESIEKAEQYLLFERHNAMGRIDRIRNKVIVIYNNERFISPDTVLGRNRGLWKLNRKKGHIAWTIPAASFAADVFRKFFEKYRPDLFIERHESAI